MRLSLIPLPRDADVFRLTRIVEGASAPLELLGTELRLFVQQIIEVVDGHCQTESYIYRLQRDEGRASWIIRWEYFRERPRADFPYPLGHLHVNARLGGDELGGLHFPTRRVPIELVLWHLIVEWEVAPRSADWLSILEGSVRGFDERRTED